MKDAHPQRWMQDHVNIHDFFLGIKGAPINNNPIDVATINQLQMF